MRRYILTLLLFSTLVISNGCRKFVELDAPNNLLVTKNVFATDETASSALVGIYAEMQDREINMPYRMAVYTGLSSDELETYNTGWQAVYQNALGALDAPTNTIWTLAYSWIYQANAVYEGCSASATLSPSVKKQIMAEALFIRAFWHFYLVNLWGDIPLVTTTNYEDKATLSRTPIAEVYKRVIIDLKAAEQDLAEDYVSATVITSSSDRVRPNRYTASALLARVGLYAKDYSNAELYSTKLISNTTKYSMESLAKVFTNTSKEAIWQLMKPLPTTNGVVTWEGNYFILNTVPTSSSNNSSVISPQLLSAFDANDLRLTEWIGTFTATPTGKYYYPKKYKVFTGPSMTEVSTVMRLGEQFLIRAEARLQQGNMSGSIADVDVIRKRAGLSLVAETNPLIGKEALFSLIMQERQRELFTEWGHRWMDLKRTNTLDARMNGIASYKKITWDTNKQLWPISQSELGRNKKLVQNESY